MSNSMSRLEVYRRGIFFFYLLEVYFFFYLIRGLFFVFF